MRGRILAFVIAALLGNTALAWADPTADSFIKEGVELRRAGRDAEALPVLERALALDGSRRARAQVALAKQALGRWVDAERDLLIALSGQDDPWVEQYRATLGGALAAVRARLATLEVEANVPGAELVVNGLVAGVLPGASPLRVAAGPITVEVRAPGFVPEVRVLTIAPEEDARQMFSLSKMPPREPNAGAPTPEPAVVPSQLAWRGASQPAPVHRTMMRAAALASFGAFAALLVGGGVSLSIANSNAAIYDDDRRCFYGGLTRDQRCSVYRDRATTAQILESVQLGAAAGLAVTGNILMLFALKPVRAATALSCSLGPGLQCARAF